ncbi:tetratricopeptide repeat protein [Haloferula chungangensis]|uniref:Tetratricopeptide repeat protein n=1 Tax=Haloferula chungangensis TaxID=1048331 RepID=A0ABW2L4C5_9BACT
MVRRLSLVLALFCSPVLADDSAVPAAAAKYHSALLKRPHQATLFDRFQGAWLDEKSGDELEAFLKAEAKDAAGWTLLSHYYLRKGQDDQALEALGKALEAEAGDGLLRIERARLNSRRLDFEAALADLVAASKSEDESVAIQASKMLGRTKLRAGDMEGAVEVWNATLKANPGDEDLLEDLVELAASEGDAEQAVKFMDQLLELTKDPYQKALRGMRRGDLLSMAGKVDEALKTYDEVLAKVGQGSWLEREVLAQIEKLFRKDQRTADLKAHLEKLSEANSGRLLIHRQLAKLEAAEGELDAAIGRFREVLKRSPGEHELRAEFIRMLVDGERLDDAVAELEKLIEQQAGDAGLWLQMAALRQTQQNRPETLAALQKARELMGGGEASDLRVAGLMLEYEFEKEGVALLESIEGAGAKEILASYFARKGKKDEALKLLAELGASDDLDTVLRSGSSISALGESERAYELLSGRRESFGNESRYLTSLVQASMAVGKSAETVADGMKLVRLAQGSRELGEAVGLAARGIEEARQVDAMIEKLGADGASAADTCLLAELQEKNGNFSGADELLEKAGDATLVRFHAALLERRGELDRAVEVLTRLADTDEGRSASYLKELASLQQRAGKWDDALKTAERWKQSAPGDKAAWVFSSGLMRSRGDVDDALREMRQAAARFDNDADLLSNLAGLHGDRAEYAEAEAIWWRLYDESESVVEQSRWATQLAQAAVVSGRTHELEERMIEKSRANRKSVGPLLGRAELARRMGDEDKRRDLLLEAVRIQPQDLDLRMQIAGLDEQSGEPGRVLAMLEEALPFDKDDRVRRALVQACLRQGEISKGLSHLRAITGGKSVDLRELEQMALSLAGSGLYEEGITLLREGLAGGADWRSTYLLASLLEEDGREVEAVPLFIDLLGAEGELKGITPSANHQMQWITQQPAVIQGMMRLSQAFRLKNQQRGQGMRQPMSLPDDPEMTQSLALAHLHGLKEKLGGGTAETIARRLEGISEGELEMAHLLTTNAWRDNLPDLLDKYPDEVSVVTFALVYAGYLEKGLEPEILRKVLELDGLPAEQRYVAAKMLLTAEPEKPEASEKYLAAADDYLKQAKQPSEVRVATDMLVLLDLEELAETTASQIKERMKEWLDERDEEGEPKMRGLIRIQMLAVTADDPDWAKVLNEELDHHIKTNKGRSGGIAGISHQQLRALMAQGFSMNQIRGFYGNRRQSDWSLETLPLERVPDWFFWAISGVTEDEDEAQNLGEAPKASELLKVIDEFDSPVMRAWLALRAGDEEAVAKAFKADTSGPERLDMALLKLVELEGRSESKVDEKFVLLLDARKLAAGQANLSQGLDLALFEIATDELSESVRKEQRDELNALLLRCRALMGREGESEVASRAEMLGLTELAKRLNAGSKQNLATTTPLTGARMAQASQNRGSSGATDPVDRVREFSASGKHEAAAREALKTYRQLKGNRWYDQDKFEELKRALGEKGGKALLELANPGASKSLSKRLEFVDICELLGEDDVRVKLLEEMLKERPKDTDVALRLAFAESIDVKRAAELLNVAALNGDQLALHVQKSARGFFSAKEATRCFDFIERTAYWLEENEDLTHTNLSWVSYYSKDFFESLYQLSLPGLINPSERSSESVSEELVKQREDLARRLGMAMARHENLAEPAFRLMMAWKESGIADEKLDEIARVAIQEGDGNRYGSVFMLRTGNGGSSSGSDLDEWTTWRWLGERMADQPAEKILPPAYLEKLGERKPELASMLAKLGGLDNLKALEEFWSADEMKKLNSEDADGIRRAMIRRSSDIDGVGPFFLTRLKELPDLKKGEDLDEKTWQLGTIVLQSLATDGTRAELIDGVETLSEKTLGRDPKWDDVMSNPNQWQTLNKLEELVSGSSSLDPSALLRLYAAFFYAGLPVDSSEYSFRNIVQKKHAKTAEEAVTFLDKAGLLCEMEEWTPPALVTYNMSSSGGRTQVVLAHHVMLDEFGKGVKLEAKEQAKLIEALENRKEGRFGAMMVLASMESGEARSGRVVEAFASVKNKGVTLTDKQSAMVRIAADWLPQGDLSKLPEDLRDLVEEKREEATKQAMKEADELIVKLGKGLGRDQDAFELVEAPLLALIPLSIDKAVALFVAAEKAYTTSLKSGGSFSRYSSSGLTTSRRDEVLEGLLKNNNRGEADARNRFAFLAAIAKSESAERLSFAGRHGDGIHEIVVQSWVGEIDVSAKKTKDYLWSRFEQMLDVVESMDPDLADHVYVGLMAGLAEGSNIDRRRKESYVKMLNARKPSRWRDYTKTVVGVIAAPEDTPEGRHQTRKEVAALLRDEQLPFIVRLECLYFMGYFTQATLNDAEVYEAIAELFEVYAGGERSVVNPFSQLVFGVLARNPGDERGQAAVARVVEAFWENSQAPKPAGHSAIPTELAEHVLKASIFGRSAISKEILARLRAAVAGDFGVALCFAMMDDFESAKSLMPPPTVSFGHWENGVLASEEMDQKMEEFKRFLDDPLLEMRVDGMLMQIRGDKRVNYSEVGPKYRAQTLEVLKNLAEMESVNDEVTVEILASCVGFASDNALFGDAVINWAKDKEFSEILQKRIAAKSGTKEYKNSNDAITLYAYAAMHAVMNGDVSLLSSVLDGFKNGGGGSRGSWALEELFTDFVQRASYLTYVAVAEQKTTAFADGAPIFADLARFAIAQPSFDLSPEFHLPMTIAKMMWASAGTPEKFDEFIKGLPEKAQKHMKAQGWATDPVAMLHPCRDYTAIRSDPDGGLRYQFLREILTRPEFEIMLPRDDQWLNWLKDTHLEKPLQKVMKEERGKTHGVGTAVLASYEARLANQRKNFELCEKKFKEALDASQGDEWKAFHGSVQMQLADFYYKQGKKKMAQEMFDSINRKDLINPWKNRYGRMQKSWAADKE